jgi:aerobic-type carbon monoxide dehydrogenase small subunit (CoxS/CutS family)
MLKALNVDATASANSCSIDFKAQINGQHVEAKAIRGDILLIDFLHEHMGLTGTKFSCGIGACSSCKVVARVPGERDWMPVLACYARLSAINGLDILTVEGLSTRDGLHPLQKAFLGFSAFQCGFSTPGMLMAGIALIEQLRSQPIHEFQLPSVVSSAIGGHVCRCTGYVRYRDAICETIRKMVADGELEWLSQGNTPVPPAPIAFVVRKRSRNDSIVQNVFGWVQDIHIDSSSLKSNDLSAMTLEVAFDVSQIRTGVRVRDLNLHKFLLYPFKSIRFHLRTSSFVDPDVSLTSPDIPVGKIATLEGSLSFESRFRVEQSVVVCKAKVLSVESGLRLQSLEPIHVDLTDFRLPLTDFAQEFGLNIDAVIDVSFDVVVPV